MKRCGIPYSSVSKHTGILIWYYVLIKESGTSGHPCQYTAKFDPGDAPQVPVTLKYSFDLLT